MLEITIKLALVDDHKLFRKGLISLIEVACSNSIHILFEASNGKELQEKINGDQIPDIVLMDINMPEMNGFDCVRWLQSHHPSVNVLVVSMIEGESSIVSMLKLGVKGYLSKDVEPKELAEAIQSIYNKGYYYTDFVTGKLIHSLMNDGGKIDSENINFLNERERVFLRYSCSELTYEQIAAEMFLSPKTIDGYRKVLFEKLSVKNRVGLALYAVKSGLIVL